MCNDLNFNYNNEQVFYYFDEVGWSGFDVNK